MSISITGFNGAALALHPKLLPANVGTDARNMRPGQGDFRPWNNPLQVATVPGGRSTIYRMGRDAPNDANYWLSFSGFVSLARGQVSSDTTERTYYTGDGVPKWTDNTIGLAGAPYPSAYRTLGVPRPTTAPFVTQGSAGTAEQEEVLYYVYTFVTDQGEESAPSPVSSGILVKTDATLNIANIDNPPGGAFTINRVRVYRTQSTDVGAAAFFFLRELAAGTTSTTDDRRGLGEAIPTVGWLPPPADLSYLTPMWNGMYAAISGKGVRYCPPYTPYAWPVEYETTTPNAAPVALAVFGQSLLVLTTGKPLLVAGSGPEGLESAPLEFGEACVAPRSVVAFGNGVCWACPDGVAWYGAGGAKMLTTGIFTRQQWQAMNPATMVAAQTEGLYFCCYTDGQGVRRTFLLDPASPAGVIYLDKGYEALFFDEVNDALYVLDGVSVQKWDGAASQMTAKFVSKVFPSGPQSYAWGRVVADAYPVAVQIDAGPLPANVLTELVARRPSLLSAIGKNLRYTVNVPNGSAFRLPSGFQAVEWQITVSGINAVQGIVLAAAVKETYS